MLLKTSSITLYDFEDNEMFILKQSSDLGAVNTTRKKSRVNVPYYERDTR